jgi:hypothetical protein
MVANNRSLTMATIAIKTKQVMGMHVLAIVSNDDDI